MRIGSAMHGMRAPAANSAVRGSVSASRDSMARRGYRLIMRSVRAHPVPHLVALLGALGFVAATVGTAWLLGWITDNVIIAPESERTGPAVAAAMVIGVSVASGVSVLMRRWFLAMAELRTQRDWRRALLHRYIDLPMDFHRERDPGELLAHADSDVNTATMVLKPLAFAVSVVVLVVVTMAALFAAHPLLALIAVVVFPALAVISRIYTRMVEAPFGRSPAAGGRGVGGRPRELRRSGGGEDSRPEPIEVERMRAASERLRDERIRVGRMRAGFEPSIDALPTVGAIVLLLVGAWLVGQGSATPGDLVLAATLFSLLALPLFIVGFFLEEMPRSVVSLERVDRVLDRPLEPSAEPEGNGPVLPPGPLGLQIDGLAVRYGSRLVLDGLSLAVSPGQTVALVGATGSGKSTLLETVAGLNAVAGGSIHLSGAALQDVPSKELHSAVALVFQEAFLFADSIAENVGLQWGRSPADVTAALDSAAAGTYSWTRCPTEAPPWWGNGV